MARRWETRDTVIGDVTGGVGPDWSASGTYGATGVNASNSENLAALAGARPGSADALRDAVLGAAETMGPAGGQAVANASDMVEDMLGRVSDYMTDFVAAQARYIEALKQLFAQNRAVWAEQAALKSELQQLRVLEGHAEEHASRMLEARLDDREAARAPTGAGDLEMIRKRIGALMAEIANVKP